jgi:hypothetical protein
MTMDDHDHCGQADIRTASDDPGSQPKRPERTPAVRRPGSRALLVAGLLLSPVAASAQETPLAVERDFLKSPGPVQLVYSSTDATPVEVSLLLRNEKTREVAFQPPRLLGVRNAQGATDGRGVTLNTDECSTPLPGGQACRLRLQIAKPFWPGAYLVDVGVGGANGGWSEQTVTVNSRFSMLVAFAIAAAGILAGAWIDGWRVRGRAAADAAIRLRGLADALEDIPTDERLRSATALLKRDMSEALGALLAALSRLDALGRRILGSRVDRLIAVLTKPDPGSEADALPANRAQLVADIEHWPVAAVVLDQVAQIEQLMDPTEPCFCAAPGLADAVTDFRQSLAEARLATVQPLAKTSISETSASLRSAASSSKLAEPLRIELDTLKSAAAPADLGKIDEMRKRLDALPADPLELARYVKDVACRLSAFKAAVAVPKRSAQAKGLAAPSAGTAPPAAPGDADARTKGEDFSQAVRVNFGFSLSQSLAEIEHRRTRNEWIFNGSMVVLAALALVGTLGASATWGAGFDAANLFMAAVGTRIAVGAIAK